MAPFVLRWGIISTGGICTTFTKDLLCDPTDRNAGDVRHEVVAVGSRTLESAKKFIKNVFPSDLQGKVKAYATYQEVYDDPNVDAIYSGVPHTLHYETGKDAMNAGKHLLLEKPATLDLAELDELLAIAKAKKVFFMEAVWTRFHPLAYQLEDLVFGGKYGKLRRIIADLSNDCKPAELPETSRLIDPALGGGALLDLGPYPMTMLLLHRHPSNTKRSWPDSVKGHMSLWKNGVDESSAWIVDWKDVGHAICSASIGIQGSKDWSVIVQLEQADIHVAHPTYRPESITIYPKNESGGKPVRHDYTIPASQGRGMNYQADEVARCIRDGKVESPRMPWEESRVVMNVFDQVRDQGGYVVKHGKASKLTQEK